MKHSTYINKLNKVSNAIKEILVIAAENNKYGRHIDFHTLSTAADGIDMAIEGIKYDIQPIKH